MILAGLAAITATAWIYVVVESRRMSMGSMNSMIQVRPWTAGEFGVRLAMWTVMMVAMMLPTAVPMTLIYAAVARKAAREDQPVPPAFVFVAGYLAMWGAFSLVATLAQRGLDQLALLSPSMVTVSPILGGVLLVATGVYELTPYKKACLTHCRAPAHFISQHWRPGSWGAFRLGLGLGTYCVGCCWILMTLLFVGGVMNLVWIAAIALFVLVEKTAPFAEMGGRIAGVAITVVGLLGLTGVVVLT